MTDVKRECITSDEQLRRWVEGDSVHRIFTAASERWEQDGECCPDFSCCKPELLAEPEVRRAFAAAGEGDRLKFLGSFLGAAIALAKNITGNAAAPDRVVVVAGDPEERS